MAPPFFFSAAARPVKIAAPPAARFFDRRRVEMRHRNPALAASALLLFAALCAPAARAQQGHSLRGKVRDATGTNVGRATVILEHNGALVDQTVTNNEGDFSFTNLMDSSYTVVVSAPDYNPGSETVEFARVVKDDQPGESRTVEITLLAKGGVRPPRAGLNFVQNVPQAARDSFEAGVRAGRDNRAAEAVAAYEKAITIFPDYFDARLVLANEMARQGKFDDAIKHLDVARRVNERDDRLWDLFARVMMQQRKYAVAARIFAQAATLNPGEPQYLLSRGTALIEQALLIDPSKSPQAATERDFAFSEAEKALTQAGRATTRKLPEVHLQLARLHEKKGDRARAADELELYLRQSSNLKNAEAVRQAIKTLRAPAAAPQKP
jgi:tetratricopeptide (TPR) repeat protein